MNTIKSYQDAKNFLGSKLNRPYANNTRIKADDMGHDLIVVTYHDNPVVHFYPDRMSLWSCGWYTLTTKERLNWFLPDGFHIYQERGTWYLSKRGEGRYIFADGITIKDGQIYNYAPESREDEVKAITKKIKKYVDGYIKALLAGEVNSPSSGDCWYCLMKDESGKSMGDLFDNTDHFESHFEESYYVPSLLWNAYKENNGLCPISQDAMARLWQTNEELSDWQANILARDVKASMTKYLKRRFGIAR